MARRTLLHPEPWKALSRAGSGIVVVGVVAKSVMPVGAIVALIGFAASPAVIAVGAFVVIVSILVWWGAARAVASRVELSTGRAMWMIWCVPTWSAVGNVFDLF